MITQLEAAVDTFVTAALAADGTLSGVTYEVRRAVDKSVPPEDRSVVILRAGTVNREIPNLHDVDFEVVLASPADLAAVTLAAHGKLETAITKMWDQAQNATGPADLDAQIQIELPGYHGADFFAEGWQTGREDTNWLPVFAVKVGVAKDGV